MIGKDEMRELHPYINTGDILGGVWIPQVTYILSFDYAHLTPNRKEILFFPWITHRFFVKNSRKMSNENVIRIAKPLVFLSLN